MPENNHPGTAASFIFISLLFPAADQFLPGSEYCPYQHHIDRGPQQDADQRVSLEHLRADYTARRDQFRKSIRLCQRRDILQAIDHQHTDDRWGKHLPQISDVWRRLFPEHQKRQEPEENRHDSHYRD